MSKEQDILIKIGAYLSKKSKARFKSNVELANVANVDEKTVRRIMAGEQNVSVKVLYRLCEALQITLADLFTAVKG